MSHRAQQVAALLQERVAAYIRRHIELTTALVTVTRVEVPPDFSRAVALVSVLPENERGTALKALRKITPAMNRELFRALTIDPFPKIVFAIDDVEAAATEVEALLNGLTDEG